jgi:hypothetical protein
MPAGLEVRELIKFLNDDDPVFDELRTDVQRLLDPPPRERAGRSPHELWLRVIVKKIRGMKLNERRMVMPLPIPPLNRNVLRLGNEWFLIADAPHIRGNRRERIRQIAYWILDQALRSGDFSQVKCCGACRRYFAATRKDRLSCSPECNVRRQNAKRQSADGKLDKYTKARWEQREAMFKKAQRLRNEGKTPKEIKNQTGLSERVFLRELNGRGLVALLAIAREKNLVTD